MDPATIQMLLQGIVDTLYMTAVATLLAYIIGLPLGVIQVEMCIRDRGKVV